MKAAEDLETGDAVAINENGEAVKIDPLVWLEKSPEGVANIIRSYDKQLGLVVTALNTLNEIAQMSKAQSIRLMDEIQLIHDRIGELEKRVHSLEQANDPTTFKDPKF